MPAMPPRAARRWLTVGAVAALSAAGCDEPNDWPRPRARRAATPTAAAATTATPAPTAACPDPLAGLWLARRFDGTKWYEHRVSLDRRAGTLYCHQESRSWPGLADEVSPPRCPAGGFAYHQVLLTCEVIERPPVLELRSVTMDVERHTCDAEIPGYNLDHFTGALRGNTWDTVNNDGGDDVDKPYRFHRVSCTP